MKNDQLSKDARTATALANRLEREIRTNTFAKRADWLEARAAATAQRELADAMTEEPPPRERVSYRRGARGGSRFTDD